MRKSLSWVSLLIIVLALLAGAAACQSETTSTPPSSLDAGEIRAYADPATETTLQGLSESDLARYTQNANDQFKAALTQEVFDKTAAQINSQLGAYQSKEYLRAEEQDGFILVHYKAHFEKGDVGIRMVFDKDHLIAGQWFE